MTDKRAALYHVMKAGEDFATTAQMLFDVVRYTQEKFPGKQRVLFLDIDEHREPDGAFDQDAFEIQTHFGLTVLMPYLHEFHMPMAVIRNPGEQRNDVPDELHIRPEGYVESFPHLFPGKGEPLMSRRTADAKKRTKRRK